MRAYINVHRHPDVLDPEGQTIKRALHRLGFDEVQDLRVSKRIQVDVPDALEPTQLQLRLEQMAEALLAHPMMEQWEIEIKP